AEAAEERGTRAEAEVSSGTSTEVAIMVVTTGKDRPEGASGTSLESREVEGKAMAARRAMAGTEATLAAPAQEPMSTTAPTWIHTTELTPTLAVAMASSVAAMAATSVAAMVSVAVMESVAAMASSVADLTRMLIVVDATRMRTPVDVQVVHHQTMVMRTVVRTTAMDEARASGTRGMMVVELHVVVVRRWMPPEGASAPRGLPDQPQVAPWAVEEAATR
ncbi:unnamed protein product, partial [Polarella glacialis]